MGCVIKQQASRQEDKMIHSLKVFASQSSASLDSRNRRRSLTRISSKKFNESDFWGTIPFYVLNNRVRLLSFEVSDKVRCQTVGVFLDAILFELINKSEKTNLTGLVVDAKHCKWIFQYDNTQKILTALGLQKEKSKITALEGITRENLIKKQREVKYAFSLLNDADFTSLKELLNTKQP